MGGYDPMCAPEPGEWLELSEDQRVQLVLAYHRRASVKLPNAWLHCAFHAVVETQVAMGEELPVARTIERLQGEGLDRHDAIHAVGNVLATRLFHATQGEKPPAGLNAKYLVEVEALTAESWRAAAAASTDDDEDGPRAEN